MSLGFSSKVPRSVYWRKHCLMAGRCCRSIWLVSCHILSFSSAVSGSPLASGRMLEVISPRLFSRPIQLIGSLSSCLRSPAGAFVVLAVP